ncbi:MAG: helix-turn-helix domain-containing protein, partial [Candidatus Limnocylindria bacterium]
MPVLSRVRQARAERGLSQAGLAAAARLSRQSVNAIENGASVPSVEAALRLAAALGRDVDELFALAGPERAAAEPLVIAGSDDPALERLVDALRDADGAALVSLSLVGSRGGIAGVLSRRADLASVHLVDPDGSY